jgi:hypothetical protein
MFVFLAARGSPLLGPNASHLIWASSDGMLIVRAACRTYAFHVLLFTGIFLFCFYA